MKDTWGRTPRSVPQDLGTKRDGSKGGKEEEEEAPPGRNRERTLTLLASARLGSLRVHLLKKKKFHIKSITEKLKS